MKRKLFGDTSIKERLLKLLNKEGFYVAIFLCITLVATLVVYFTNNNLEKDLAKDNKNSTIEEQRSDTEDVSKTIEEKIDEPSSTGVPVTEVQKEVLPEEKETPETEKKTTQQDNTVTTPPPEVKKEPVKQNTADPLKNFQNPVSSNEVVMAFSMGGAPVYSNTLKEFTSDHPGVDIKAEEGADVKAAIDGKVVDIVNDTKYGRTVIIQHTNSIVTRYSNLAENVGVTKNQRVKAGQLIGKVGKTASFEIEDPPHLHFELLKDGKHIDPTPYLK